MGYALPICVGVCLKSSGGNEARVGPRKEPTPRGRGGGALRAAQAEASRALIDICGDPYIAAGVVPIETTPAICAIASYRTSILFPLDGSGFVVPSFRLHPVSRGRPRQVPPGNAMSRFVGFGDKSRDGFENFFQTQGFEFLFLSQRPRLAAFGGSIAPKMPVLKLSRPLACKPPAAIVSESARVACASCAKPQLTGLRHRWSKGVVSGGLSMSRR